MGLSIGKTAEEIHARGPRISWLKDPDHRMSRVDPAHLNVARSTVVSPLLALDMKQQLMSE